VSAVIPGSSASRDDRRSYAPLGLLARRALSAASFGAPFSTGRSPSGRRRRRVTIAVVVVRSWIFSSSESSNSISLMLFTRLSSMAVISVPLMRAFFAMPLARSSLLDRISATRLRM
jgi:hypothetical protein